MHWSICLHDIYKALWTSVQWTFHIENFANKQIDLLYIKCNYAQIIHITKKHNIVMLYIWIDFISLGCQIGFFIESKNKILIIIILSNHDFLIIFLSNYLLHLNKYCWKNCIASFVLHFWYYKKKQNLKGVEKYSSEKTWMW